MRCSDCRVKEGDLHQFGCDQEICPFCGKQLISCNCAYIALGYDYDSNARFCGLPEKIYNNGLSIQDEKKWIEILNKKGRIPYIRYPIVCAKCGKQWPDFFNVSDEEWAKYIQPDMRRSVICKNCYNEIKMLIDNAGEQS